MKFILRASVLPLATLFLISCGKNAHVTSPDPNATVLASPLNSQTQQLQNPIMQRPMIPQQQNQTMIPQQDCTQVCVECVPIVPNFSNYVGRREPAPLTDGDAPLPVQINTTLVTPDPTHEPVVLSSPVPTAEPTPPCGDEPRVIQANLRGLDQNEYTEATDLPYYVRSETVSNGQVVNVTATSYGQEPDGVNVISRDGLLVTKDNQVVIGAELPGLPDLRQIKSVDSVVLTMGLTKFENKSEFGSEILCSMDLKRCSGRLVHDEVRWPDRKNLTFFSVDSEPVNDQLGDIVREERMTKQSDERFDMKGLSGRLWIAQESSFELTSLYGDSMGIIEKSYITNDGKRLIRLVVADDIYPINPTLTVKVTVNTCVSAN